MTLWLLYALIVIAMIGVPVVASRAQETVVYCSEGMCAIRQDVLEALVELAKRGQGTCI